MYTQLLHSASSNYGIAFYNLEVLRHTDRTLVIALNSDQGDYILKCIHNQEDRLRFILDVEQYLRAKEIHIPRTIATITDNPYMVWQGHRYVLQEKLTGVPSLPNSIHAITNRALLLGRMHASSIGFRTSHGATLAGEWYWQDAYIRKLHFLDHWKERYSNSRAAKKKHILDIINFFRDIGRTMADRLKRHAYYQSWRRSPVYEHYLCHGDFHSDNVLTVGSKLYIIDWEFVRYDYPSKDISRFVLSLTNRYPSWDPQACRHLLDAYLRMNPLNDCQLDLMFLDLIFPHNVYHYLQEGRYRKKNTVEVVEFLQKEYEKTCFFLNQIY